MRQAGPRFTIRSLMIAVAAVAGLLALALSPNGIAIAFGLLYLSLVGIVWLEFRDKKKRAARYFGIASAVAIVGCAVLCIYFLNFGGRVLMFIVWFFTFPVILGAGGAWATAATRPTSRPRRSPFLAGPLVMVAAFAPLSMILTSWPLRLAFLASRPAMERLANRVADGERPSQPEWAGLFRVIGTDVQSKKGNIGLIIVADSTGRSGFVWLGPGVAEQDTHGPFYNLDLDIHLGGRWFYQCED
jgi:hypothetical protein